MTDIFSIEHALTFLHKKRKKNNMADSIRVYVRQIRFKFCICFEEDKKKNYSVENKHFALYCGQ